jgi:pimeloyl-ACP methyl ester carboxylesterase
VLLLAAGGALGALVGQGFAYSGSANRRWPADGRFVVHDRRKLHVLERGAGPLVVCIHGASANAREFLPTIAPALADDFRIVMMDRPGHGHSAKARHGRLILSHALAAAAVVEACKAGPAIIVGHSFGAAVSLRLALERPDLVRGLVLVAPACNPFPPHHAWHTRLGAVPILGPAFAHAFVSLAGPMMSRPAIAKTFAPAPIPDGYAEVAGVGLLFRRTQFSQNAALMDGVSIEFAAQAPRYPDVEGPVIIITADKDHVVSPKRHAHALNDAIVQAELIVTPGAGHMPHQVRPDVVAQAVRRVQERAG